MDHHEHSIPQTQVKEGTAKRNVKRKHGSASRSHLGGRHKGDNSLLDDGSMDYISVLDKNDPNYDPDEHQDREYGSSRRPKITLAEFKREVESLILEFF